MKENKRKKKRFKGLSERNIVEGLLLYTLNRMRERYKERKFGPFRLVENFYFQRQHQRKNDGVT